MTQQLFVGDLVTASLGDGADEIEGRIIKTDAVATFVKTEWGTFKVDPSTIKVLPDYEIDALHYDDFDLLSLDCDVPSEEF